MAYYQSGYNHSNPAYNGTAEKYRQDNAINMPDGIPGDAPRWSWCSTGWSVFVLFCCASWCGFMGLLCSLLSYTDHKAGDYERSNYKRKWSWGCTMFGMILTILIIVAIVLILVVFYAQVGQEICKQVPTFCNNGVIGR